MTQLKLSEIAAALNANVVGDPTIEIAHASEPAEAGVGDLALAMDPKYAEALTRGQAKAALLWEGADWQSFGLSGAILVSRARVAMSALTKFLDPGLQLPSGIHPSVIAGPDAKIGANVCIGPFVVIGAGAEIADGAIIDSHTSIGAGAKIGADSILNAGTRIGRHVRIGERFISQPGAVIGADGFSFTTPELSKAEAARETMSDASDAQAQAWMRIHSLGSVIIGDDVEIGANSCVDAGTIRPTRIGNGTKIDNHVHVAHNCEVGQDCLFAGQVGIAGSVKIGNNVILGGQVGVVDNIFVGDGVVAGGASVIMSNVPAGRVLLGYPAVKMDTHISSYKALRRLPRLAAKVDSLEKQVSNSDRSD